MINRDNFLKQKFSTGFIKKVEGEGVSFDNSIGAPFNSFNGDGKSTQETTNGNQLLDFANPEAKSTGVSSTFENNILTIVGTAGSSWQSVSWLFSKTLLEKNKGKTIKYKHKSAKISNQEASSNVQISVYYTDDTPAFYKRIYNFNTQGTDAYVIPSDISNIRYFNVGIYTNNSANTDVENTLTIEEPLLYFDDNDTYEPYTGAEPSPSPDYPQQINSIGDNLEYVKTKLPSEYQEVEYIESHQNQYIDTGILTSDKIRIECEYSTTYNGINLLFGARRNINTNGLVFGTQYYDNTSKFFVAYGGETVHRNSTIDNNDGNKHKVILSNEVFTIDNENQAIVRGDFTASFPIFLGTFSNNNFPDTRMWRGNIYSCKIYDNNNLVRDFVPCYRKSDNVIGMYDLANNIFYTNSGTGDFLKGADVSDINLNIDLGEEKLRSIDDVKDELVIDMSTGDYYKVENIGEVIFDGSNDEGWRRDPLEEGNSLYSFFSNLVNSIVLPDSICTSNYFIYNKNVYFEDSLGITVNWGGSIRIKVGAEVSTTAELVQWLSTHNTIVDYQLATPITKKIGTLSKEDLNKLSSFDGHNNILVNTNLGLMNIRLEYRSKIN